MLEDVFKFIVRLLKTNSSKIEAHPCMGLVKLATHIRNAVLLSLNFKIES